MIKATNRELDYTAMIIEMRSYPEDSLEHNRIKTEIVINLQFLIRRIAFKNYPSIVKDETLLDDLISEANCGLLSSMEKFDLNLNIKLNTFAYRRIHGAMADHLRKIDLYSRTDLTRMKKYGEFVDKYRKENNMDPTKDIIAAHFKIPISAVLKIIKDIKNRHLINSLNLSTDIEKDFSPENQMFLHGEHHDSSLIRSYCNDGEKDSEYTKVVDGLFRQLKDASSNFTPDELLIIDMHFLLNITIKEITILFNNTGIGKIKNDILKKLRSSVS